MGGTFDPPHRGHLTAAREVIRRLGIQRVIFIPAASPPHKGTSVFAPATRRLEMVRLAIGRNRSFSVSAIEMRRPGPSYTLDTVRAFRRRFPGRPLYFIVGADTVPEIPRWHRWRDLLRLARFVAVSRPGFPLKTLRGNSGRIITVFCRGHRASSAQLRALLGRGRKTPGLPPAVASYIKRHGLYRPGIRGKP